MGKRRNSPGKKKKKTPPDPLALPAATDISSAATTEPDTVSERRPSGTSIATKDGQKKKKKKKKDESKQPVKYGPKTAMAESITLRTSSKAFKSVISQAGNLGTILEVKDVIVMHDSTSSSSSSGDKDGLAAGALHSLDNVDHVFMQRLLDYQDVEASGVTFREDNPSDIAYQIVSNDGQLLFLMEQHKILCTSFIICTGKSFESTLYDLHGNKVLKIIGPSVCMSRTMGIIRITDGHGRPLGYIKAFGPKVNYSVYNARSERVFLLSSKRYLPTSKTVFTILSRGHTIGVVRNAWNIIHPELLFLDSHDPGVTFPVELDEREKALLIGCMTLIEFTWYSPVTKLKLFFIFTAIFLSIFTLVLVSIPIMLDKEDDTHKTLSAYSVEKREFS